MSGIQLSKGARINLSKSSPGLTKVRFGLTWGENKFDTGAQYDLDGSVFLCSTNGGISSPQLVTNDHFVFYGKLISPDGAVVHSGDNRTGDKVEDDEVITITLASIEAAVEEISFVVTIHEADLRKQNFGQIPGSKITMTDETSGALLATYSLEDDFSTETAVQFGSLYKKDGEWLFKAVGAGFNKGLGDFVVAYGGTLA